MAFTEEQVEAAAKAVSRDWQNQVPGMRLALAAAEQVAPRPVIDRAAVREEIRAGLNSALCNGGHPETGWSPSAEVDRITDAVMALLNGQPATSVQTGYDAVYGVLAEAQQSREVNGLVWRGVHAFREAMGIPGSAPLTESALVRSMVSQRAADNWRGQVAAEVHAAIERGAQ
jgi:hypothetical protein